MDAQKVSALISNILKEAYGDPYREATLKCLHEEQFPKELRMYDHPNGLKLYCDSQAEELLNTTWPRVLTFAANYIEIVYPDKSAKVQKGGLGPAQLARTTEPYILSALERVLSEDNDLV